MRKHPAERLSIEINVDTGGDDERRERWRQATHYGDFTNNGDYRPSIRATRRKAATHANTGHSCGSKGRLGSHHSDRTQTHSGYSSRQRGCQRIGHQTNMIWGQPEPIIRVGRCWWRRRRWQRQSFSAATA